MSIKRSFIIGGKWVTVEPSSEPESGSLLMLNTWNMDSSTGQPTTLLASFPLSRNQLFDVACGLLCAVLDSEPEGVFDTSLSMESNIRSAGYTENIADLMDKTEMDDPAKAVTRTVAMYRRLDSRLPVLQNCQRALEMCESEFDVNTLSAVAGRMERNLSVQGLFQEINGLEESEPKAGKALEYQNRNPDEDPVGLEAVPDTVVFELVANFPGESRKDAKTWFRPTAGCQSNLCVVLKKLNLAVAVFDDRSMQIRSDLVTPDRAERLCKFSPRLTYNELERFCSFAMPNFEALFKKSVTVVEAGEAPLPPSFIQVLVDEVEAPANLH